MFNKVYFNISCYAPLVMPFNCYSTCHQHQVCSMPPCLGECIINIYSHEFKHFNICKIFIIVWAWLIYEVEQDLRFHYYQNMNQRRDETSFLFSMYQTFFSNFWEFRQTTGHESYRFFLRIVFILHSTHISRVSFSSHNQETLTVCPLSNNVVEFGTESCIWKNNQEYIFTLWFTS